jgi:hypothetical protein
MKIGLYGGRAQSATRSSWSLDPVRLVAAGCGVCCLHGLTMWPVVRRSPLWVFLEPHLVALKARLNLTRRASPEGPFP